MKRKAIYLLLTSLLIIEVLLSISVGAVNIPIKEVMVTLSHIFRFSNDQSTDLQYRGILEIVRIPRVVLGLLVGGALGISGAAIQGLFRNPLAEPGLIGVSSGATLMSAIIILLEATWFLHLGEIIGHYLLTIGAFIGATIVTIIVYHISKSNGKLHIATMLLAGIAINALAGALTGLISFLADDQQLRNITFWMLGSLAGATWETIYVILPFIFLPIIILPSLGKRLNAFALGENQAESIGINSKSLQRSIIILATLAVGAAVSVSGIIGFIGLLVPHMVRLIGGADNRYVLPASAIMGALVLTISDMLTRIIIPPMELPIGVVTTLIGTPVFLYILLRDKKKILQ